jgi:hypothetical protein
MPTNNPQRPATYLKDKKIVALTRLDDEALLAALDSIARPTYNLAQFLKAEIFNRPRIYHELAYIAARFERPG